MKINEIISQQRVPLIFETIQLSDSQVMTYANLFYEAHEIDDHNQHLIVTHRRALRESHTLEVSEFLQAIDTLTGISEVKVGDSVSLFSFLPYPHFEEVLVLGFTEPKTITEIKMNDGRISYIKFDDGSRYPKLPIVDNDGRKIEHPVFLKGKSEAEQLLTHLQLIQPDSWTIDTSELDKSQERFELAETTTSGSIAPVSSPLGSVQKRPSYIGKGIYANEKGGSLFTGKKTSKKFPNSVEAKK